MTDKENVESFTFTSSITISELEQAQLHIDAIETEADSIQNLIGESDSQVAAKIEQLEEDTIHLRKLLLAIESAESQPTETKN